MVTPYVCFAIGWYMGGMYWITYSLCFYSLDSSKDVVLYKDILLSLSSSERITEYFCEYWNIYTVAYISVYIYWTIYSIA